MDLTSLEEPTRWIVVRELKYQWSTLGQKSSGTKGHKDPLGGSLAIFLIFASGLSGFRQPERKVVLDQGEPKDHWVNPW